MKAPARISTDSPTDELYPVLTDVQIGYLSGFGARHAVKEGEVSYWNFWA